MNNGHFSSSHKKPLFRMGEKPNCERNDGGACAVDVPPCPPSMDTVMTHPSPLGYRPWCWQTALFYEIVCSLIFFTVVFWSRLAPIGPAATGVAQGMTYFILIAVFLEHDAGFLNPAFVLALAFSKKLPGGWLGIPVYFIGQAIGSLLAVLFVLAISPGFNKDLGLGTPIIAGALDDGQAALAELIGSFILILVGIMMIGFKDLYEIHSSGDVESIQDGSDVVYKRKKARKPLRISEGLIMGFILCALVTCLALFTGGCLNLFGWLWPAAISGSINNNWWVYALMPFLAAIAVYLITAPVFYWEDIRWSAFSKKFSEL